MMKTTLARCVSVCAGLVMATIPAQEAKLVFRDFPQLQKLRVVCSHRHFGRLDDLVADVPSGRLRGAVVTMQVDAKSHSVLVPFEELAFQPGANLLELRHCAEKDASYEPFDPATVRVVTQPSGDGSPPTVVGTVLVSRLQQGRLRLRQGGTGSVQGVTLEMTSGHLAFLDLATTRERAGDSELHPVPWSAVRLLEDGLDNRATGSAAPTLALDKTAGELAAAPNLVEVIVSDPLYRAKVYAVFGGRPAFDKD